MAERRDDLRAADADRQFVAERLRTALDEGRLNLAEYDERLQQAYAAKTYGELDRILDDLPNVAGAQRSQLAPPTATAGPILTQGTGGPSAPPGPPRRKALAWVAATWGSWLSSSLVCTVVYLLTDPGGYPWPLWVAGPWGVILLVHTVRAYASGDPHGYLDAERQRAREREQTRREARLQHRRDRWR